MHRTGDGPGSTPEGDLHVNRMAQRLSNYRRAAATFARSAPESGRSAGPQPEPPPPGQSQEPDIRHRLSIRRRDEFDMPRDEPIPEYESIDGIRLTDRTLVGAEHNTSDSRRSYIVRATGNT